MFGPAHLVDRPKCATKWPIVAGMWQFLLRIKARAQNGLASLCHNAVYGYGEPAFGANSQINGVLSAEMLQPLFIGRIKVILSG